MGRVAELGSLDRIPVRVINRHSVARYDADVRARENDKRLVSGGGMMHRFLGSAEFLTVQPFIPLKSGKNPSCFLSFDLALDFVLET